MGTSCGIAVKTEKGYNTIYCHWDGYPEYMLAMLRRNYDSIELATKLVSFGDASSIGARLEPTPGVTHTFDNPEDGVCVFYNRDRGERWKDVAPKCLTLDQLRNRKSFDFVYVFENREWWCLR